MNDTIHYRNDNFIYLSNANKSEYKPSIMDITHYITNVLVIFIIVIGIFLSIFCFYKLCVTKEKKAVTPLLLALTGSNILFIVLKLPLNLSYVGIISINYSGIINSIRKYLSDIFKNCTNLTTCLISIQRCHPVFAKNKIDSKLSTKNNWIIVTCIFIGGLIFTYFDPPDNVSIQHMIYILIPLLVIIVTNIIIYCKVSKEI